MTATMTAAVGGGFCRPRSAVRDGRFVVIAASYPRPRPYPHCHSCTCFALPLHSPWRLPWPLAPPDEVPGPRRPEQAAGGPKSCCCLLPVVVGCSWLLLAAGTRAASLIDAPYRCHVIAMVLPCYGHAMYCHAASAPCCCHVFAMLLPCYCQVLAMLLPCHC